VLAGGEITISIPDANQKIIKFNFPAEIQASHQEDEERCVIDYKVQISIKEI